ncbi:MAG: helix-turn-helix domain-containing protein [Pseudonocardiaceae bacterium]
MTSGVDAPPKDITLQELMTEKQFAEYLKVGAGTLAKWRRQGHAPPNVTWDGRIYYVRSTVNAWLEKNLNRCGR